MIASLVVTQTSERTEEMPGQRQIDIYSAGCAVCENAVQMVRDLACPSCNITIKDMKMTTVATEAKQLGIRSVPAVVIDGQLADCCSTGGPNAETLKAAGIGTPLPYVPDPSLSRLP